MPWQDVSLSVRPSVTRRHSAFMGTSLNVFSQFFHRQVAPPFLYFHTKWHGNIRTGTPLTGASNARGYEKITIFDRISLYLGNGAR